jgi:hypothetical protein
VVVNRGNIGEHGDGAARATWGWSGGEQGMHGRPGDRAVMTGGPPDRSNSDGWRAHRANRQMIQMMDR